MKADQSRDFHGLTLIGGGFFYKLTSILHKKNDSLIGSPRLAIGLVLITWLPLCILTLITGLSDHADSSISFFEDFFVHVRFLLVLPFLILVEKSVDTVLTKYIQNTLHLVPEEEEEKYLHHVNRIHKFIKSPLPEILVLIVVYALIILHWRDISKFDSNRIYLTSSEGSLKAAGYYYLLVCIPLLKVIIFR